MSKVEEAIAKRLLERADVGFRKYGVTMERQDLDTMDWLKHLQEELMDAAVYVERLMEEYKTVELSVKYGREFAEMMRDLDE